METVKKVFIIVFLLLICFWIFIKLKNFSKSESQFAQFEQVLFPMKDHLNSKTNVSFYNPDDITEFFYRAQFNLAPIVLERNQKRDTLIFFCENSKMPYTDTSFMAGYNKVKYCRNDRFTAVLLIILP